MSNESLACTYAAIMLSDAGVPATAENIAAACEAAGVQVRDTLPIIFSRYLKKNTVESLMAAAAAVAPAAAAGAPAAASGGAAPAAADGGKAKKEEKVEEEADDDMGFGLFD